MYELHNVTKIGSGGRPQGGTNGGSPHRPRLSRRRLLRLTALGGAGVVGVPSTAAARSFSHTLTIEGVDTRTEYAFSVSGDLAANAGLTGEDDISGSTATGAVGGGRDSYRFSGDITEFSMSSDANVRLDGEAVGVSRFLPRTLTVAGTGSRADYTFEVSGGIAGRFGHSGEDEIDIKRGRVTGAVSGGRDSYAFSGDITDFELDGDATLFLDGEEVAPAQLLPNTLSIGGTGSYTAYSFTVSGDLAANRGLSGEDSITGSRATGAVGGGRDSYTFSGDIAELSVSGDARLVRNGERVAVDAFLPRVLTIDGTGSRASYSFSVGGGIAANYGMSGEDDIDIESGRVAGAVGGGSDSYRFSGELVDITIDSTADAYLDGEIIGGAGPAPLLGVHSGLSDGDFETIRRMEDWQGAPYAVQNLFVPWNPDTGHMDWLFERVLPRIWDAGRVPLITWEPFTPGVRAASVDTQSLVARDQYDTYLQGLADTTPNDIEERIANGAYDGYIKRWTGRLREWLAGPDGRLGTDDDRRAYLRLAHEMNGDWYPWSPTVGGSSASSYVDMWRHVHRQFMYAEIDDTVEWMWCVNADDVGEYRAEELYPGDGYVDWLSIDGYQWGESQDWSRWESPESIFGDMLGRVRTLADKPVCIAETASTSMTRSGNDPARKDDWIRSTFEYFDSEGVELWCWFNEDKETDWAMFDGVRGTERVAYDGERVNAYAAYREAVDTHAATASSASEPMTTPAFTGER